MQASRLESAVSIEKLLEEVSRLKVSDFNHFLKEVKKLSQKRDPPEPKKINREQALYHRDEFRTARANASKDAEAYDEVLFALERLGYALNPNGFGLGDYKAAILTLCENSALAVKIPEQHKDWHTPIEQLYKTVKNARNDALHQGAFARHLTTHAIELAIILEDALSQAQEKKEDVLAQAQEEEHEVNYISDFMVRDPICASLWQPISFVRQQMLVSSFSYLPLWNDNDGINDNVNEWHLVSDIAIARYLSSTKSNNQRKKRLATTLGEAIKDIECELDIEKATILHAKDRLVTFFSRATENGDTAASTQLLAASPALVCREGKKDKESLIGIITAFDLL